jgi:HNH endonuclease
MSSLPRIPVIYRGQVIHGYYFDEEGNIYSTKKRYVRKLTPHNKNVWCPYPKVSLSVEYGVKKTLMVHRLVCESFHEKPLPDVLTKQEWNQIPSDIRKKLLKHIQHADRYQVNHIDHDKNNYHPSNLEWVTTMENQQKYQEHKKKLKNRRAMALIL